MMNGRFQSEQGSLPTVLLVSIILGGLIVALFTVVQSSQVSSARDRDVNQSIQVADAGVQEAFVRLVEIDEDSDPGDPVFASVGDTTDLITGEAGEGTYSWQARRIARSLWEVRSVGNYRTHESVVESQMGLIPMFFYALWGDSEAGISAGNAVIGHLEGGAPAMGSNGPITLHNFIAALVPDNLVVECHGDNAAANCDGIDGADLIPGNLEFPDLGSLAYAPQAPGAEVGGECWDSDTQTEINDGRFTGQFPLIGGQTYCFSQVTWPQGGPPFQLTPGPGGQTRVQIYINPVPQAGDPEASLLVGGTGTANASIVNWEPESVTDPMLITTTAADLIIRAGGTRPVEFRNNSSRIAAGIYAPLARCEIRAQVTVVGSMICGEVPTTGPGSASGGWSLYYDPELDELTVDGVYRIRQWVQESCGDSSFDWGGPAC
jgi:hypothetical protein